MKKGRSYSDLMKSNAKKRMKEPVQGNLYVQMILDEILFKKKANNLRVEIDKALDQRDIVLFHKLSKEYQRHMKHA